LLQRGSLQRQRTQQEAYRQSAAIAHENRSWIKIE
jgi:hypothetical protein